MTPPPNSEKSPVCLPACLPLGSLSLWLAGWLAYLHVCDVPVLPGHGVAHLPGQSPEQRHQLPRLLPLPHHPPAPPLLLCLLPVARVRGVMMVTVVAMVVMMPLPPPAVAVVMVVMMVVAAGASLLLLPVVSPWLLLLLLLLLPILLLLGAPFVCPASKQASSHSGESWAMMTTAMLSWRACPPP